MQNDSASSFFDRWEPPAYEPNACPTPEDWENITRDGLLYENTDPPPGLKEHLGGCKQCESIFQFLQQSSPDKYLKSFITMIREKAETHSQRHEVELGWTTPADKAEVVAEPSSQGHRVPFWRYVKAYFFLDENSRKPRFAMALVCLLVFMAGVGYWIESRRGTENVVSIDFSKDSYEPALRVFMDSIEKLKDATNKMVATSLIQKNPIQDAEVSRRWVELNSMFKRKELDPYQRAEVVNLVTLYNMEIARYENTVLQLKKRRSPEINQPAVVAKDISPPETEIANESNIANKLYKSVDEAVVKTTGGPTQPQVEVAPELLPVSPSKQIEIVAMDANKLEVVDLVPGRKTEELEVLKSVINAFAKSSNYSVKLKSGVNTFDFPPRGSAPSPGFPQRN